MYGKKRGRLVLSGSSRGGGGLEAETLLSFLLEVLWRGF